MVHKSKSEEEKISSDKKTKAKRQKKLKASMRKINSKFATDLERLAK